ncbi:MAG: D-2-hydroxyacid dehydrogenase family protein [Pigmentiphaga sp.]|uniref:D-2-hydroxyacid dehydrogenase family protein n=1 Tax=Pigmentiphaga sp. TaxID=1977564 RepID=UPI0029AD56DB|nr:D-2-hydroxyacid dehydrogenase family protein [Pigmentiphaga sp.]MDX3904463.1 D-2-hydroxyacid dehydrogenase family protein [Pigmentiphaga sp.]
MKRLAILDDYLHLSLKSADWSVLQDRCRIDVIDRKLEVPDEAARVLAPYHILCHLRERTPMPRALLERLPKLEFMTVTGKAHRTLDLEAAVERGIVVSHVSSAVEGSNATPELAWGLILATARHIAREDRHMREGGWQHTAGMLLDGKTLGLLGLGRVGQRMAAIGRAFGMRVIAWSPNLTSDAAAAFHVERVDKDSLFRQADVLSIHVVLSERSRHLVGAQELGWMKPEAILINTARGAIVDEAALVEALVHGRLGGAGLDVFEHEPLPAGHPFTTLENVVLTPHLGYVTRDTLAGFYRATVQGVAAYLDGRPIGVRPAQGSSIAQ